MDYKGKKAAFQTLGCKLNFSETSAISRSLEEAGFLLVNFDEKADLYVINTCSVTSAGDKSSRNAIRRAVRSNPGAFVVVAGCYAQLSPDEIARIKGVDLVVGTREKFLVTNWLGEMKKKEKPEIHTTRISAIKEYVPSCSRGGRTRSFLKIQDGCDYYCSYCIIPYARGRSRNESIENTFAGAVNAVENGFREIVLTGVNIGDFGKSTGETYFDLLVALEKVEGLERLRMGSLEPDLLTDGIIAKVAESKVIMPHFHLPLQSGSDEILKLMRRKYTSELFASRVAKIRERIPDAFIGVDVIAGFSGETEALFLESYEFLDNMEVSQIHAFTYSERTGTMAAGSSGIVPVAERRFRTRQYINLSEKKLRSFYEKNLNTTHSVLLEEECGIGRLAGFTCNYIRTEVPCMDGNINEIPVVKLVSILPDGNMLGEIWVGK